MDEYWATINQRFTILGFSGAVVSIERQKIEILQRLNFFKTPIIKKPSIAKRIFGFDIKEKSLALLWLFFIKRELILQVINLLGDEFINRNIVIHDDSILMFLLSRNALNLKHLENIFYIILIWPKKYSSVLTFQQTNKKNKEKEKIVFLF